MSKEKTNQVREIPDAQAERQVKQVAKFNINSCNVIQSGTVSDTSRPVGGKKDISVKDIYNFSGDMVKLPRSGFLCTAIISLIIGVILMFALYNVGFTYLNIILGCVFVLISFIFVALYAKNKKAYFKFVLYYREAKRDDLISLDYWNDSINVGEKFPAKIEILSAVDEQADKQNKFVSKLGTALVRQICEVTPEQQYSMVFGNIPLNETDPFRVASERGTFLNVFGYGPTPAQNKPQKNYVVSIDPEEKTIKLLLL